MATFFGEQSNNGHLTTSAQLFCPQGGCKGEVQLYNGHFFRSCQHNFVDLTLVMTDTKQKGNSSHNPKLQTVAIMDMNLCSLDIGS